MKITIGFSIWLANNNNMLIEQFCYLRHYHQSANATTSDTIKFIAYFTQITNCFYNSLIPNLMIQNPTGMASTLDNFSIRSFSEIINIIFSKSIHDNKNEWPDSNRLRDEERIMSL